MGGVDDDKMAKVNLSWVLTGAVVVRRNTTKTTDIGKKFFEKVAHSLATLTTQHRLPCPVSLAQNSMERFMSGQNGYDSPLFPQY